MGQALCPLFKNSEVKVLYIGLDAAGKTTLLYKLKLDEVVTTIPTIGFNVEEIEHNGVTISTWDVGSRDKMRPLWRHYYDMVDAIVFLIDSKDRERLDEAVDELMLVVPDAEERTQPILVLANKQDIDGVMSPDEIREAINAKQKHIHTPLEVFPTSALTGDGVDPALDWLLSQLTTKLARKTIFSPFTEALYDTVQYPASALKSSLRTVTGFFTTTTDNSEDNSG
ncbi:hypothetical protein BaRGS_00029478 [Batillaria attramentaria]|uniref:ADP-ribosylation factor n=1 Tax=Batillaria attramentaria TaxID=370345 RepID=A0ABD0JXS9_9CAEN